MRNIVSGAFETFFFDNREGLPLLAEIPGGRGLGAGSASSNAEKIRITQQKKQHLFGVRTVSSGGAIDRGGTFCALRKISLATIPIPIPIRIVTSKYSRRNFQNHFPKRSARARLFNVPPDHPSTTCSGNSKTN